MVTSINVVYFSNTIIGILNPSAGLSNVCGFSTPPSTTFNSLSGIQPNFFILQWNGQLYPCTVKVMELGGTITDVSGNVYTMLPIPEELTETITLYPLY